MATDLRARPTSRTLTLPNKNLSNMAAFPSMLATTQYVSNAVYNGSAGSISSSKKVVPVELLKSIENITLDTKIYVKQNSYITPDKYEITTIVQDVAVGEVYLYIQGTNVHYRVSFDTFIEHFDITTDDKLETLLEEKLSFNLFNDNDNKEE